MGGNCGKWAWRADPLPMRIEKSCDTFFAGFLRKCEQNPGGRGKAGGGFWGGAEPWACWARKGGAPRQFVRKTDVFPTQCLLKSGFVSRISSPPFRPVRVRFRSHPNQCPAPRHVSPLPPHPPPTRRPLFL